MLSHIKKNKVFRKTASLPFRHSTSGEYLKNIPESIIPVAKLDEQCFSLPKNYSDGDFADESGSIEWYLKNDYDDVCIYQFKHAKAVGSFKSIITEENTLISDLSKIDWSPIEEHPLLSVGRLPKSVVVEGKTLVILTRSSEIYFHWLQDALPRLLIIKDYYKNFDDFDAIYIDAIDRDFIRETLELIGVPISKVIDPVQNPVVKCEEMIVPSYTRRDDLPHIWVLNLLRKSFLPKEIQTLKTRVFVSRKGAGSRSIQNEDELFDIVEPHGFKKYVLEDLTVREQIHLFCSAEYIIASHGSALANLTFCQKGATVLELFNPNRVFTMYAMISSLLNVNYYYLIGSVSTDETNSKVEGFEDLVINKIIFQSLIKQIIRDE